MTTPSRRPLPLAAAPLVALLLLVLPAAAAVARAQEPAPAPPGGPAEGPPAGGPPPAAAGEETAEPEGEPAEKSQAAFLPRLDVFFPEGELDLRASRLADKVYFEGQVKYSFVNGDITAFLRYRYYGLSRIYQLTGFDAVEFQGVEKLSTEFERVRGLLFLTEWPLDVQHRSFLLGEVDRITSNKEALRFDNDKTNTFLRLGYQIGTPYDPSLNAIVGERRAQVPRLFTAFRDLGEGDFGVTAAATYGFDFTGGDFSYVKVEAEGLKRVDLPADLFLVGRVHGGSFPYKRRRQDVPPDAERAVRYTIPRQELFRLDGRDNLKGVSERIRGTEQLYTTLELFVPWFLAEDRRALGLVWDNWYWIFYSGYGATGFETSVYGDPNAWYPDVGIGFESSFRLRKYRFFLSGIVAQALEGTGGVEARLSVKSYR